MVGDEGDPGGTAARLTTAVRRPAAGPPGPGADVRAAYDAAAGLWAAGPERVYAALAETLLASAEVPLVGQRVLDMGAGTGVAARAALAAGAARVAAADLAAGMLRRAGSPLGRVAADATALPFRTASFDLVVAAFCLNHLASVPAGLAEARRVGRAIAASTFTPGWTHPAKAAVDAALHTFGYRPPVWYTTFKQDSEPAASDPGRLGEQAAAAGFAAVRLRAVTVATGLSTPAQLAAWRLGMAQVAPFVLSLDEPRRAALRRAAERSLAGAPPLVVSMTVLTAS